MAVTEQKLDSLCEKVSKTSTHMRLFSLSMRSLFAEKSVGGGTSTAEKFRKLRDNTRDDAVVYVKHVLPVATRCVANIKDYFEFYVALTFDEWWENIDDIIEEAETHKQACSTLVKMHESLLVPLKQRQDQAKVILIEMKDLAEQYEKEVEELKNSAKVKNDWALGLAFIPFVGLIASPILGASGDTDLAKSVAKKQEVNIQVAATEVVSQTLIPALSNFISGLEHIAGFFQILCEDLHSFKDKAENAGSCNSPKKLHYNVMNHKASAMMSSCDQFYAVLPGVRTDFEAIPTEGTDQNYVDRWLEKQKKIINDNCKAPKLVKLFLKAIKE